MTQEEPKDISNCNNRKHTVVLTVQAEITYRELQKKDLPYGWLNRKLSEFLVDNFGDIKKFLISEMMEHKKQRDKHEKKYNQLAKELHTIKEAEKTKQEKEQEKRDRAEAEEQANEEPTKVLKNVLDATRSQVLI